MIPRGNIIALNVDASREEIFKIAIEQGYSRLPVYKGTIDNIIGTIYTKDLISTAEHRELITLQDILRPSYYVPETHKVSQLMRELQKKKIHLAIVVSEYGGTEGIITMEDIIEEIIGDIQDEYDVEQPDVVTDAAGTLLINPLITIERFNQTFHLQIPEDPDYQTVAGFLEKILGRIPEIGEQLEYQGALFTITKKKDNRLIQIKINHTLLRKKLS
jgi:CBS domain containing-hemolysin-like protein